MNKKTNKIFYTYLTLAVVITVGFFASVAFGSSRLSFAALFGGLTFKEGFEAESIIVYNLRLPRALGAIIAGAGLALSDAILQRVTNNKLAGPNIIGVNAGAGFAVVLFSVIMPLGFYLLPMAAFLGAFLTTLLIVLVAKYTGGKKSTIILAGIAVTALFNAFISFIMLIDDELPLNYRYFSVGGLYGVTIEKLIVPFIIVVFCVLSVLFLHNKIDALALNDTTAFSLGVNAKAVRLISLIIASLSAAAAVSFAGLLGFVGLAVPHIAKRIVGIKTKYLAPISALLGGALLLYADLFGRIIFSKTEIPLGIITAFLGAPFFFILLIRGNKNA